MLGLTTYLLDNGLLPEQITAVTPYVGQLRSRLASPSRAHDRMPPGREGVLVLVLVHRGRSPIRQCWARRPFASPKPLTGREGGGGGVGGKGHMVDGRDARRSRAPGPHAHGGPGVRTACGQRCVWTAKTVKRPRQQPAQLPIRQLLSAADAQTAHPATSSTAPAHQPLGSVNAETTPAGAPAAAADSDPTQHAKGRTGDCPGPRKETATRGNVTRGRGECRSNMCVTRRGSGPFFLFVAGVFGHGSGPLFVCSVSQCCMYDTDDVACLLTQNKVHFQYVSQTCFAKGA